MTAEENLEAKLDAYMALKHPELKKGSASYEAHCVLILAKMASVIRDDVENLPPCERN